MSRILILGGAGEMGSLAVADLAARTDHDLTIGDVHTERASAVLAELGRPDSVVYVDVSDSGRLPSILAEYDIVLNATLMRFTLAVTDAAIEAGTHLVDLGSYRDTLEQLDRHDAAVAAGVRVVPGCGAAPGLTNVLVAHGARELDSVRAVQIYSYLSHPLYVSPGIVTTRFDAVTGVAHILRDGQIIDLPADSEEEEVVFAEPLGRQEVHLVPHPEVLTLSRSIAGLRDAVFKVGYPAVERSRLRVLLDLGFGSDDPFEFEGKMLSPRRFAAAYIGKRGMAPDESSRSAKRVYVHGTKDGVDATIRYDFANQAHGRSASSIITAAAAAIATDLVAQGGRTGVLPPELGLDAGAFLAGLEARGMAVTAQRYGAAR